MDQMCNRNRTQGVITLSRQTCPNCGGQGIGSADDGTCSYCEGEGVITVSRRKEAAEEVSGAYRCPYCDVITDAEDQLHMINANNELVCRYGDITHHDTGKLEKWLIDRESTQNPIGGDQ